MKRFISKIRFKLKMLMFRILNYGDEFKIYLNNVLIKNELNKIRKLIMKGRF